MILMTKSQAISHKDACAKILPLLDLDIHSGKMHLLQTCFHSLLGCGTIPEPGATSFIVNSLIRQVSTYKVITQIHHYTANVVTTPYMS
jgi:hypothetical protein